MVLLVLSLVGLLCTISIMNLKLVLFLTHVRQCCFHAILMQLFSRAFVVVFKYGVCLWEFKVLYLIVY